MKITDSKGEEIRVGDRVRVVGLNGEPIGPASEALTIIATISGIGSVPPQVYTEDPCVDESLDHFNSPDYRCPDLLKLDNDQGGNDGP